MKVKVITSCPSDWYSIGQILTVVEEDKQYYTLQLPVERRKIDKDDCEIIEEDTKMENKGTKALKELLEYVRNMSVEEYKEIWERMDEKSRVLKKFQNDVDNMNIIASEMSSIGVAIENLTGGLTGRFHGLQTRVMLIKRNVDKKELKYREIIEK